MPNPRPVRSPTGAGNLLTFKKMKWKNPFEGEIDTCKEVKFGKEEGATNNMGWRRNFHVIDGTEHPKLFLQWLIAYRKEALSEQADLRPNDRMKILDLITSGEVHTKIQRSLDLTNIRLTLPAKPRSPE